MMEELSLSPVPTDEACAQLGDADYSSRARKESRAFINQLRRQFGDEPSGARFRIAQNPHDFGIYLDVEIRFSDSDETAAEYAYAVEANLPEYWDEAAKLELAEEE